jgi:hypothetical protein
MSRVTLSLFAAAAVTLAAAGTANAQCCGAGYVAAAPVVSYSYPSACCNSGFGVFNSGCCNTGFAVQAAPVVVQAAPVVVQAAPVVVQQPVIVQQPVVVQPQPVVQQYVVNQGPVYAGPGLSDPRYGTWYAPRAVGAYPYVAGLGGRWGYRRAYYGGRPYWHARRAYYRNYHRHHGPISVHN